MASVRIDFQRWLKLTYEYDLEYFRTLPIRERNKIYNEYEEETKHPSQGGVPGWIC